jgi:NitT/TauT family transport system substrate-binding protein
MRRQTFIAGTGAALVATPFSGIGFALAQELKVLKVGVAEGDDATPTLYAVKAGLFKKFGLDVQVTPMPSGAAALAALSGGAVDIAGSSLLPFLSARNAGLPLTIVAPLAVYSPESVYAAILVKKDSTYKTGKDLNGKTIASPAIKDLNWVASMAWIDKNGGDSSTCKSIEMPGSVIPAALDEGRVDASTVTTPRYIQAVNTGKVRVLGKAYEAIGSHFLFAAFVSTNDFANKNADIIARFGRAIRDASAYTNTHHDETMPIYAAFAKIDPKDIAGAPRAVSARYVDAKDIQPILDIARHYNILTKPVEAAELLSPSILKVGA